MALTESEGCSVAPSSLARTPMGLHDLFSPSVMSASAAVSVADARGHFLRQIMTSPLLPASSAAVSSAQSVPRSENWQKLYTITAS